MNDRARFYSPKLGRFLSADTIVPGYANPQAWNRYSYVLNNSLKYTDPTGHIAIGDGYDDDTPSGCDTMAECGLGNDDEEDDGGENGDSTDGVEDVLTNSIIALDLVSWAISFFEAGIADFAIAGSIIVTGGSTLPEALLIDYALASHLNPLASIENGLGYVSLGLTAISDGLSGNTYISSGGHLLVGKDTIVAARNTILGNYPESNFDLAVNTSQVRYDMDRLNGVRSGGSIDVSNKGALLRQILWYDSPLQDLFNTFR